MSRSSLEFHIESDDYFGTLATILNILTQDGFKGINKEQILNEKIEELMYLQSNYKIIKK